MDKKKTTEQKAFDVCYLIIGAFKNGEKLGAIEWNDLEACHEAALQVRKELKQKAKDKPAPKKRGRPRKK